MAEYYCVMRGKYGWWVTATSFSSEEYAREYASDFKSELAGIVAGNTGIRPPVGMRGDQASHEWLIQRRFQQPGLTADMCYTTVLELVPR